MGAMAAWSILAKPLRRLGMRCLLTLRDAIKENRTAEYRTSDFQLPRIAIGHFNLRRSLFVIEYSICEHGTVGSQNCDAMKKARE